MICGRSGTNCDEFKTPNSDKSRAGAQRPTSNIQHPTSRSEAEEFACGCRKQVRFLFGGKFHQFNELARFRFAKRERIIGAKCNALRAEKLNQYLQCVGVVNE